jgi:hypothetical protein
VARITPSGLIADIRGSVGSHIFQGCLSGLSLHGKGHKPLSLSQCAVSSRSFFAILKNKWSITSAADRASWDAFAIFCGLKQKHSTSIFISGLQMFIQVNSYRLAYSLSILAVPPAYARTPVPVNYSLNLSFLGLTLTLDRALDPAVEYLILSLSPPLSLSRSVAPNLCKLIPVVTYGSSAFVLQSFYIATFGYTPRAGMKLTLRATLADIATGQMNPFYVANYIL